MLNFIDRERLKNVLREILPFLGKNREVQKSPGNYIMFHGSGSRSEARKDRNGVKEGGLNIIQGYSVE